MIKFRTTVIAVVAAVLLGCLSCLAIGSLAWRTGRNPIPSFVPVVGGVKPEAGILIQDGKRCDLYDRYPDGAAFHKDDGCPVAVGKGFTIDFHTVDAGWAIRPGTDGPVMTATVRNANPGAIGGFWHSFHLNRYDGSLTELVTCETGPFAAGESRTIACEPGTPSGNAPFDSVAIS